MNKLGFLLLIICMWFSSEGVAQNLYLHIHGKTDADTAVIDSLGYTKRHENFLSIKSEVDSLKRQINKMGFIENRLLELKKKNDSVFNAKFHLKQKFNTIYIYYNSEDVDSSLLNSISENVTNTYFTINIEDAAYALNFLNSELTNKGLPFAKLKLLNIKKKNSNDLRADLRIISNQKKRTIDDIKIVGYEKFPKSFVKHYLKLKPFQIFDLATIEKKTEQLNNLRFANQVKPPEVLFQEDSTSLYIYVEKAKSNTFDGFLGFGTNEDTNRLEFDGFLNLRLINNLNYGELFSLLYKSDENDQDTFDARLELPYLFGSSIGVDLNLRIFRKDSSFTTTDQKARINYQINALHKVSAGISSTASSNLRSENVVLSLQDYNSTFFTASYEYLKPTFYDRLFPIKSNFYLESNFGNRTSSNIKTQQSLFVLKAYNNFKLNRKNSIYLNADAANLISDNYFENELLRFGGINSIRGFEENSLFASLFGVLNTEYRYRLSNSIYIHSITDVAYFENKISDIKEKLFGFGFGFGILTNSGLLKFNYANGKNENQKFKLSNSKIHISLVAQF
ncbi:POTRA domain-containing protein [Hyunsoonleella aquatilis]